ncbi:MAG: hypothetical protein JO007_19215 [Alphaproteobacteria bacterium]|nr:hypothetical protein [Alphaproteobacteria bacterium]
MLFRPALLTLITPEPDPGSQKPPGPGLALTKRDGARHAGESEPVRAA